jgi:hypothetical protein
MTQKYHFVDVTLTGNKNAVVALVYMYFGHVENVTVNEIGKNICKVTIAIPVSQDEIEAELNDR